LTFLGNFAYLFLSELVKMQNNLFSQNKMPSLTNFRTILFCLLSFFFCLKNLPAAPPEWRYEDAYRDRLAYLHAYLNYDFNAVWYNDWEENYFSGNGFLLAVGSVTTHDLLVNGSLVINQSLGNGWWFRGEGGWLDTYHLSNSQKFTYMGLEKEVGWHTSLYMLVNPAYDKEYTDLNMGVLFADSTRRNYLRLGLVWEDFVYDEKNDYDGISATTPLSLQWFGRYNLGKFTVLSSGRLSRGFDRSYPNQERSPLLSHHRQRFNTFNFKLYYAFSDLSVLSFSAFHYLFAEQKEFYEANLDYDYNNHFYLLGMEYMLRFQTDNRFRIKLNSMDQSASSEGYNRHIFSRQDIFTGVSYERFFARHTLELQYIFAYIWWDYRKTPSSASSRENGLTDKIKLGWMYTFPQGSKFYISISHELQGGEFGGANLNYILLF